METNKRKTQNGTSGKKNNKKAKTKSNPRNNQSDQDQIGTVDKIKHTIEVKEAPMN